MSPSSPPSSWVGLSSSVQGSAAAGHPHPGHGSAEHHRPQGEAARWPAQVPDVGPARRPCLLPLLPPSSHHLQEGPNPTWVGDWPEVPCGGFRPLYAGGPLCLSPWAPANLHLGAHSSVCKYVTCVLSVAHPVTHSPVHLHLVFIPRLVPCWFPEQGTRVAPLDRSRARLRASRASCLMQPTLLQMLCWGRAGALPENPLLPPPVSSWRGAWAS